MASVCNPSMEVVGFQQGEKVAILIHVITFFACSTVVSRWSRHAIQQMPLLFFGWVSSLAYTAVQVLMAIMVLNCWAKKPAEWFIYTLKFIELFTLNCYSMSSMCIMIVLAAVVRAYDKHKRITTVGNQVVVTTGLVISLGVAISSAAKWRLLLMTGTYFWVSGKGVNGRWVNLSFNIVSLFVGVVMFLVILEHLPRHRTVTKCCQANKTVWYYTLLSLLAVIWNLVVGFGSLSNDLNESGPSDTILTWTAVFRDIHMLLNMVVLYWALRTYETQNKLRIKSASLTALSNNNLLGSAKLELGGGGGGGLELGLGVDGGADVGGGDVEAMGNGKYEETKGAAY